MGHLLRVGVHLQGVHEERDRHQKRVAARSCATLLQVERTGGFDEQENAEDERKSERRIGGKFKCLGGKIKQKFSSRNFKWENSIILAFFLL